MYIDGITKSDEGEGYLKGSVVGFGNPLLDITANVEASTLEKYGLLANNAILAEEKHLPLYQELPLCYEVSHTAGGSSQNTMRTVQWLLPADSTVYVGCIGKDENGRRLRQVATQDGLCVEYLEVDDAPTGTCACLITANGQCRSLVANLGAAKCYSIEHLQTLTMQKVLEQAKLFYLTGFFMTVSPATMIKVAQYAQEQGKILCFNLSAPFVAQFYLDHVKELMPYVDYLFGNEAETLALAQALGWSNTDIGELAQSLASLPKHTATPRHVVITQGPLPTLVATTKANDKISSYPVDVIPSEEIVDTNGAGDAFVGGFLSQLVQSKSTDICVRAGQYAAGVIIRRSGITFPERPNNLTF